MYNSTRDSSRTVSASQAILQGISDEGGLFVPQRLPQLSQEMIAQIAGMNYVERAGAILGLFLDDFATSQVAKSVIAAYDGTFEKNNPAPVIKLPDGRYVLELFKGPTCAFKDMALRVLPQLMSHAAQNTGRGGETLILVATSGDTGKAALEGFKDAKGVKIMVFYPIDGVSPMQKLQMSSQEGGNVGVCAVRGNFDSTQTGVKRIFANSEFKRELAQRGIYLSSANSINWGRFLPQIVYYFSAYADLLGAGEIQNGQRVNFVVPTGNFGNILAAYYAGRMGLPVGRLICASNKNKVLTDFITTGKYNVRREFFKTLSPSMDILISSNLERLLYHLLGDDDRALSDLMSDLANKGCYSVPASVRQAVRELFYGGSCNDERTSATIRSVYKEQGYLLDTHTAVAVAVANDYQNETNDDTKTVIVATASPYKFSGAVYGALTGRDEQDEFTAADKLSELTGVPLPSPLANLKGKAVRFNSTISENEMPSAVIKFALGRR